MSAIRVHLPAILFLEGVSVRDYKWSELQADWQCTIQKKDDDLPTEQIPILFRGLDTHPKKTTLLCWNCCRVPPGRPWFEPQTCNINFKNKEDITMQTKGVFCSVHCVKRYILTYTRDPVQAINKTRMLKILYSIFNSGKQIEDILPAPPHTERKAFGGTKSDEEYEECIRNLDENFQTMKDQVNFKTTELTRISRLLVED